MGSADRRFELLDRSASAAWTRRACSKRLSMRVDRAVAASASASASKDLSHLSRKKRAAVCDGRAASALLRASATREWGASASRSPASVASSMWSRASTSSTAAEWAPLPAPPTPTDRASDQGSACGGGDSR